jgi:hypothetical protein
VDGDEGFEGPTVGVVVADRFEETAFVALEDILTDRSTQFT